MSIRSGHPTLIQPCSKSQNCRRASPTRPPPPRPPIQNTTTIKALQKICWLARNIAALGQLQQESNSLRRGATWGAATFGNQTQIAYELGNRRQESCAPLTRNMAALGQLQQKVASLIHIVTWGGASFAGLPWVSPSPVQATTRLSEAAQKTSSPAW